MFERVELIGLASAAVIGLAFAGAAAYARFRTSRHLNRLRNLPLEK